MISDDSFLKLRYVFGHPSFVMMADAMSRAWQMTSRFKCRMSIDEWIGTLSVQDLEIMSSDLAIFRDEAPAYWAEMLDRPPLETVGKVEWMKEGF